ncbi:hypothetical protein OIV83_005357 [Microbotryomycetes sp. JL201]|nr:hypothetical protein OIV83_005357 [Microbotryomycetes sp. JL201]
MSTIKRAFYGPIVHSKSVTEIEYLTAALLGVNEDGTIAFVDKHVEGQDVIRALADRGWGAIEPYKMNKGEFLMPGMIDTHTHAPQYVNLAYGQQFELLDWLKHVTFPTEKRFSDPEYAARTYEAVVQRLIDCGTTTVCYYGTLHMTTTILAAVCKRKGQRAFVGKCNMDRESAPDYQEESAEQSLEDTRVFIDFVRRRLGERGANCSQTALVQPIVTPRFAIACSDELLSGLGRMLSDDPSLPCQTHLSENPSEIAFTKSLFPGVENYAAVYDKFGLLRRNTILAHCVHLEEAEIGLIAEKQCGVSHCPNSNFNLRSGATKVGTLLDRGIKVGLGTDVSGGCSIGILSAIRSASTASKTLAFQARDGPATENRVNGTGTRFASQHLSVDTLFYLATMGGAELTCLDDRIGNFMPSKEFDALLVQTGQKPDVAQRATSSASVLDVAERALKVETDSQFATAHFGNGVLVEPEDDLVKIVEKFLFGGDDRNIGTVFVRGRVIGGARPIH